MVDAFHIYLDDSGTRHPDRSPGRKPFHNHDWFGMGGVLIREADEDSVRAKHAALCAKWKIADPLHSAEIRARSQNFTWVGELPPDRQGDFMHDLTELATSPQLTAIACVIDRPGYNHRYLAKYGRKPWLLCKTAFVVVVERAAKYAREKNCKLRVYVEKSDKNTDAMLRGYYDDLRNAGHPFDASNSAVYAPLESGDFHDTLYDFKTKNKSSPLMQIADLCLWPMCIGGYDTGNRTYAALRDAGTLIDAKLPAEAVRSRGIKYSCWDVEDAEKARAQS